MAVINSIAVLNIITYSTIWKNIVIQIVHQKWFFEDHFQNRTKSNSFWSLHFTVLLSMDQRNSRTILSIGKDSLQRVQKGKFCIIGLNAIGTEIAKSLLLFGANFLTFVDNEKITEDDYKTNFYVKKENIGMERCKVISNNIKQINQYYKAL